MFEPDMTELSGGIGEDDLKEISQKIMTLVKDDLRKNEERELFMKSGYILCGLEKNKIADAEEDETALKYPLILQAASQFWSRAVPELMPSSGPVKGYIVGDDDPERRERRDRVVDFMNFQCLLDDPNYISGFSHMLWNLALEGSFFRKVYYDGVKDTIITDNIKSTDFITDPDGPIDELSMRFTHRRGAVSQQEIKQAHDGGIFARLPEQFGTAVGEDTKAVIDQQRQGQEADESDSEYSTLYDVYIYLDRLSTDTLWANNDENNNNDDAEEVQRPYVVTIDSETETILSIYRNYDQTNKLFRREELFHHYKYMPSPGYYGLGLFHLLGDINDAATHMLRDMIEISHNATLNGGFVSNEIAESLSKDDNNLTIEQNTFKPIDSGGIEDFNRAFYSPPQTTPNSFYINVLNLLDSQGNKLASTTEAMTGSASPEGPVGTIAALIEQSSKVYSAIHKRIHDALRRELQSRYLLNSLHLPESDTEFTLGEKALVIKREDFNADYSVIPVSDSVITSQQQRVALARDVWNIASQAPDLFNMNEALLYLLNAIGVSDAEMLVRKDEEQVEPPDIDPVSENIAMSRGEPVKVYPEQNHVAHAQAHVAFLQMHGGRQDMEGVIPAFMAHIHEHMLADYQQRMQIALQGSGVDLSDPNMVAEASAAVQEQMAGMEFPQFQQPDPEMAKAQAEIQRESMEHENKERIKEETHREMLRREQERHELNMNIARDKAQAQIDNDTAKAVNKIQNDSG